MPFELLEDEKETKRRVKIFLMTEERQFGHDNNEWRHQKEEPVGWGGEQKYWPLKSVLKVIFPKNFVYHACHKHSASLYNEDRWQEFIVPTIKKKKKYVVGIWVFFFFFFFWFQMCSGTFVPPRAWGSSLCN